MENRDVISRIITIIGTVLIWLVLLAPFILGFFPLVSDGIYRFDYLMPVELGLFVFAAGLSLLWAANRTKLQQKIIAWGLGSAFVSISLMFILGDSEPGSLKWVLVIGLLVIFWLATIVMGIGGIRLWRDLFGSQGS